MTIIGQVLCPGLVPLGRKILSLILCEREFSVFLFVARVMWVVISYEAIP